MAGSMFLFKHQRRQPVFWTANHGLALCQNTHYGLWCRTSDAPGICCCDSVTTKYMGSAPAPLLICHVTLGMLCPLPQFPHITCNILKSITHDSETRKNAALIALFPHLPIGHEDCDLSITLEYVSVQHSVSCTYSLTSYKSPHEVGRAI